ncbi:MAG: L-aspartate oxidase [Massilibacillus sp.]|jgi:L-aspartate oxidase|nr:L-aspartate oxidase [Massilibacillus sp.]
MMKKRSYIVSPKVQLNGLASKTYDVVIVGAGIAGMSVALSLNPKLKVALMSKEEIDESSTYKAQGGMAISIGANDSPEKHIADTLHVGRGLCRQPAVEVLIREGAKALEFLESLGTNFNHDENGICLSREAGHSENRIVHYYDYTGRHIAESMAAKVAERSNIDLFHHCFLVDILTKDQQCNGCIVENSGELMVLHASEVVIATGGYSGLFARSTNTMTANGDGIAAAYRAGAVIADMEFVQFHPTAFTTNAGKVFLLTEALRGEGAYLLNDAGKRFMLDYHPSGELAPRDEVARGIVNEMKLNNTDVVYLDARHMGGKYLADRFRQVYSELVQNGYHMERDLIPIAPAAHYTIGGILTDLLGKSTLLHLYACGEAASTGVHGANRLASNSLSEGVVFGRRVAHAINTEFHKTDLVAVIDMEGERVWYSTDIKKLGQDLARVAGVLRKGEELSSLLETLKCEIEDEKNSMESVQGYQACNACQLAELLLEAALFRRESRGTHYRADYLARNDVDFNKHTVQQWGRRAALQ